MDLLTIFKIINCLGTVVLIAFAWKSLKTRKAFWLFSLSLIGFSLSTVFLTEKEAILFQWFRHIPFYLGQFLLYLFITEIITQYFALKTNTETAADSVAPSISKSTQVYSHVGIITWLLFLSQQGLAHIITVPFLFLIISYVRVQYLFIESAEFKSALNDMLLAVGLLTMAHFAEFIIESQKLMPLLEGEPMELIETSWFFLGLLLFYMGLRRLKKSNV